MLRSMLFVPADSERKLAKGAGAGADALILDLEDSVLPERKRLARGLAREYLQSHAQGGPIWIRVNDLASGELLEDLVSVVPARPAGIVLPKIRGPEDIQIVTNYLDALEAANGIRDTESTGGAGSTTGASSSTSAGMAILALVTETAAAVLRMGELVRATAPRPIAFDRPIALDRLVALGWGAEDLSSALGAGDPRLPNGAWRPMYEHARCQCILAAHALGVEAIDTVYVNYRDAEGLRLACQASRYDGFTGRFAIHPDQVPVINQAYTPSDAELALAQRIVAAFASGAGAVSLDGKMYDIPHLKAAQRLIQGRRTQ
jgi:citrate lyase subunit beta/citryl-CoA lyase